MRKQKRKKRKDENRPRRELEVIKKTEKEKKKSKDENKPRRDKENRK